MRAIVVRHYGGPEALELARVPVPEPGNGTSGCWMYLSGSSSLRSLAP